MLAKFLNAVYHPNRAVEVLNLITLLYRLGLTGHTDRIDEILKAETGTEPETIAGNIEKVMVDGLFVGYSMFGVDMEYDPQEISTQADLLEFLALWDSADGVSPESYPGVENIHELGMTNIDILTELFEMAGKNHDGRLLDWIERVSDSLILRIQESFTKKPLLSDEASTIPNSSLSDFRLFAVHYPDAQIVEYIKQGGAIGISFSTMVIKNDAWFDNISIDKLAIELVGMAMVSDMDREGMREQVAKLMEPVFGSTAQGQRALLEINRVFTKVLSNGNHQ